MEVQRAAQGVRVRVGIAVAAAVGLVSPAHTQDPKFKVLEIPHCARSLGTVAVRIPQETQDWWSGQRLASPDTVVRAIVKQSGCFTLVDRGAAMQLADEERARAQQGALRRN